MDYLCYADAEGEIDSCHILHMISYSYIAKLILCWDISS